MLGKTLAIVLAAIIAIYLAICGLLYLSQRAYIYYPVPRQAEVPSFVLKRPDADVVVSTAATGKPQAVLYFGGNAEDVSQAVTLLARAFPARAVYAMHYRSYGGSSGVPSEQSLVADAKRLFELVATKHSGIVIVGRSLGSGVAIQVAASHQPERLVLVTPYDSITALAESRFRLFPVSLLLRDKYESWRYASRIRMPTTLIVAKRDQIIPNTSSLRLAGRFPPGIARAVEFEAAGHNDISEFHGYAEALAGADISGKSLP